MMEELEKEIDQHNFSKTFVGLTDRQIELMRDILKQCYRLVLVGCAYGTLSETFAMFFNGLQDHLKEFSDECYFKAFGLGSDIFMQRMREEQGERKQ
jgi:hypothetical protein